MTQADKPQVDKFKDAGETGLRPGVLSRTIIVASCLWMVAGTILIAKRLDDAAHASANAFFAACAPHLAEGYDCLKGMDRIYHSGTDNLPGGLWGFAAGDAAILLTLGLIVFLVLYGTVRWILVGRKPKAD